MVRKSILILSIVAALALTPTVGMAYNFGLVGATIAGEMHSDQGQPNVYFKLKWHIATNVAGSPNFGLSEFNLYSLVGDDPSTGLPQLLDVAQASTVTGQTITGNSVLVDYWLESGHSIHKYPYEDLPYGAPTGQIELTSITFSKEAPGSSNDLLTFTGTFVGGLYDGKYLEFALVASSANSSPTNQYAQKYNTYVSGGSGSVPFTSVVATAGVATPEPGTLLLLGSALFGGGLVRRRRRRQADQA